MSRIVDRARLQASCIAKMHISTGAGGGAVG